MTSQPVFKPMFTFLVFCLLGLHQFSLPSVGVPLSASGRWIVDDVTGERVKLACVNWPAHLEPMLAEGLDKRPMSEIVATIRQWGFNCVRLTYAIQMFTNSTLANATVRHTFDQLGLHNINDIAENNPTIPEMTTVEALQAVAAELAKQRVMIILDNQMSKPGWCCSDEDNSGFWGDAYFAVDEWLQGLKLAAAALKNNSYVVAMSIRNELRGPRQNIGDWFKYTPMGADAIHSVNPDLLILHGGLGYDTDLHFVQSSPLNESLGRKRVYEIHRYAFSGGYSFASSSDLNDHCSQLLSTLQQAGGYLTTPNQTFTGPLMLTEFGVNLGTWGSDADNTHFIACLSAFMAGGDIDWAVWSLQGSYYLRQQKKDNDEDFGLFNHNWTAPRNRDFLRRLQRLQLPFVRYSVNDAAAQPSSHVLFHPASGLCVHVDDRDRSLFLDSCNGTEFNSNDFVGDIVTWNFTDGKFLLDGNAVTAVVNVNLETETASLISTDSANSGTAWNSSVSPTGMQFATTVESDKNRLWCLDGSSVPTVRVRPCLCIDSECLQTDNPSLQWFKLVPMNTISFSWRL